MKQIYKRTLLLVAVIGGAFTVLYFNQKVKSTGVIITPIIGKPSSEEVPLQDRMDLEVQQEVDRTKDLNLGYVPTERLLLAKKVMQEKVEKNRHKRLTAAISGIVWTERGPNNQGGRTRAILVDLNDATRKTVFVGGVGGGLWKTTDITVASPAWTPIDNFFDNLAITAIAQHPTSPNIIYFGTGEGYFNADAIRGLGIWKSTDGGTTFAPLSSTVAGTTFQYVQKMIVTSAGTILASTRSGGVRRSTDGGTTWTKVLGSGMGITGANSNNAYDLEIAANGDIFASLSGSIHKSTNDGVTFAAAQTLPTTAGRIELATAGNDANYVYALVDGNTAAEIYQTTDAGATWVSKPVPTDAGGGTDFSNGQAWYDLAIAVDPNNRDVVLVGALDLFKSTNGGSTWGQIAHWYGGFGFQNVHADQHLIIFEPGNSNVIYFGNDGGVYRSTNGTAAIPTISSRGNNYRTVLFYGCAIHPTAGSNFFLAGAQDNGSHRFNAAGMVATAQVSGGDGAFCNIDQNQPQYMFTQYVYNNYYRSINTGASFSSAGGLSFGNTGQFINPTDYDNNANHLYASHDAGNYFRWLDPQTGATANSVTIPEFNGAKVTAVTCSEVTSDRVWFGLNNGDVVRVDNAASATPTATLLNASLPGGSIACIAVDPTDENHLLTTFFNYGTNSIWESTNGGVNWASVEGDLPDMPIRWALFNPYNTDQALVATELGVWSTDNLNSAGVTDWEPSNTGLANVRVDMLQIRPSDNTVIASTHGRGLYSTTIPNPTPVELADLNGWFENENVKLSWVTYSEKNNSGFDIERSDDGINFYKVGFVQGAGNSNIMISYSFLDVNVTNKEYYYRLKQIDFNAHSSYSEIIFVKPGAGGVVEIKKVYPNPATSEINIQFASAYDDLKIRILDVSGRELMYVDKDQLQNSLLNLNITSLSQGTYNLLAERKGKVVYFKFTKF